MGFGGAGLIYQFRQHGGQLEAGHLAFPLLLIVAGVLYFLGGEYVTGKKKEAPKEPVKQGGTPHE